MPTNIPRMMCTIRYTIGNIFVNTLNGHDHAVSVGEKLQVYQYIEIRCVSQYCCQILVDIYISEINIILIIFELTPAQLKRNRQMFCLESSNLSVVWSQISNIKFFSQSLVNKNPYFYFPK